MRIIAIDASRGNGVVSRSVDVAARSAEAAGAVVERVRLASLDIRFCTECKMCRLTGACKIDDDLPDLAEKIASSDGVIFGVPAYFRKADRSVQAVLDRLASFFADDGQLRLPGFSAGVLGDCRSRSVRRAVIITACRAPEPLATFFGYTQGPIRELREALGSGGIKTVGSLAVAGSWSHEPELDAWECDKARSLGRVLAGKI